MKPLHLLTLLSLLSACATPSSTIPPPDNAPPEIGGMRVLGERIVVRLSGVGTTKPTANATISGVRPQGLSNVNLQFSDPAQTVVSSADAFATGVPRSAWTRYLYATVTFINKGPPLENLVFIASQTDITSQTAIQSLERFPGLGAYSAAQTTAIARRILPTSPVSLDPFTVQPTLIPSLEDALQIYSESELPSGDLLPYGFKAQAGNSRIIPTGGKATLTIAFRVPMQPVAADDPYSISVQFRVVQDSGNRVTESLEAQLPTNQAAFDAAVTRNGGQLRLMPGTTQPRGFAACSVRTAGPASSPSAYLVNQSGAVNATKLVREMTVGQTLPLGANLTLSSSSGSYDLLGVSVGDASVARIDAGSITALRAGTTTINIDSCGLQQSTPLTVSPAPTITK